MPSALAVPLDRQRLLFCVFIWTLPSAPSTCPLPYPSPALPARLPACVPASL